MADAKVVVLRPGDKSPEGPLYTEDDLKKMAGENDKYFLDDDGSLCKWERLSDEELDKMFTQCPAQGERPDEALNNFQAVLEHRRQKYGHVQNGVAETEAERKAEQEIHKAVSAFTAKTEQNIAKKNEELN